MFTGNWTGTFVGLSEEDRIEEIRASLLGLGNISIHEDSGRIRVMHGLDGFGTKFDVHASFSPQPDGAVRVHVRYSASPTIAGWILTICFFPVGLLMLLLPYKAREEFASRLAYVRAG